MDSSIIDSLCFLNSIEKQAVTTLDTSYLFYNYFLYGNDEINRTFSAVTAVFDKQTGERVMRFHAGTQAEVFRRSCETVLENINQCKGLGYIFPNYATDQTNRNRCLLDTNHWQILCGGKISKFIAVRTRRKNLVWQSHDEPLLSGNGKSRKIHNKKFYRARRPHKDRWTNVEKRLKLVWHGPKNKNKGWVPDTRTPQEIYNQATVMEDQSLFVLFRGIVIDILKNYGHIEPPTNQEIYKKRVSGRGPKFPEYSMFASVLGKNELIKHCSVISPPTVPLDHETLRSIPMIARLLHDEYDARNDDWETLIDFLALTGGFNIASKTFADMGKIVVRRTKQFFSLRLHWDCKTSQNRKPTKKCGTIGIQFQSTQEPISRFDGKNWTNNPRWRWGNGLSRTTRNSGSRRCRENPDNRRSKDESREYRKGHHTIVYWSTGGGWTQEEIRLQGKLWEGRSLQWRLWSHRCCSGTCRRWPSHSWSYMNFRTVSVITAIISTPYCLQPKVRAIGFWFNVAPIWNVCPQTGLFLSRRHLPN